MRIAFETAGRGGPRVISHTARNCGTPCLRRAIACARAEFRSLAPGLAADSAYSGSDSHVRVPYLSLRCQGHGDHGRSPRPAGILGSGWWRYRLPGLGVLDWSAIFSALADIGYDGIIAIENEDPLCQGAAGVRWAADYLRTQMLPHQRASGDGFGWTDLPTNQIGSGECPQIGCRWLGWLREDCGNPCRGARFLGRG